MSESRPAQPAAIERKAHVTVTRAFGTPCPVGYHEGDAMSVDLDHPEAAFRCPGVREALEPYLEVAKKSETADPLRFAASCHCPYSKSEVVFYLHVSPPIHHHAA